MHRVGRKKLGFVTIDLEVYIMNAAIEFKNIRKAYGDKTVIENLNLTVEQGEFVTIVGSSGCGKTTALKMINGLIDARTRMSVGHCSMNW